jgi:hypothetical protein
MSNAAGRIGRIIGQNGFAEERLCDRRTKPFRDSKQFCARAKSTLPGKDCNLSA